jgi:Flp pilus assembly protein TadG
LGIINFGYLFGQKLSLNQAVREGTRMAVVPGQDNGDSVNSTAEIQQLVRDSTGGLVTTSNVTVVVKKDSSGATITAGCGSTGMSVGDQLRVEATYPATSLVRLPLPGFPSTFNLKSTAVYRCEW